MRGYDNDKVEKEKCNMTNRMEATDPNEAKTKREVHFIWMYKCDVSSDTFQMHFRRYLYLFRHSKW